MSKKILVAIVAALSCAVHAAPKSAPVSAQLTVRGDTPGAKIDANICGQFMEHLGRNV